MVTAVSACSVFVIRRKREEARPAIMTASVAVLTWAWLAFVAVIAEDSVNFKSHASQRWISQALEAEAVRGVPIGRAVTAPTGDKIDESVSLALFKLRSNSVPLYALGMKPEYLPDFKDPEGWEMRADRALRPGVAARRPRRPPPQAPAHVRALRRRCAPAARGGVRPASTPDRIPRREKPHRRARVERRLSARKPALQASVWVNDGDDHGSLDNVRRWCAGFSLLDVVR